MDENMEPLTAKQLKTLKALAHHLKPVVYIGKNGITGSLLAACESALNDHELVKIKFIGFKEEKRQIVEQIMKQTGSVSIGITGNTAVLFRQNDDPEKRIIAN
jgi:RNA-binding protein